MWSRIALFAVALPVAVVPLGSLLPDAESDPEPSIQQQAVDTRAALERLEGMVGSWSSVERRQGARPSTTTFRRTGGGKTLVNDAGGMLTVYHPDGATLMLTHYCGAGNQPRMRLQQFDGRKMVFAMFDITNLATPQSYHTTHVELVFTSEDKVTLTYRGIQAGRESSQVFDLTRQE